MRMATAMKIMPVTMNPPNAYSYPILLITISAGEMKAKLDPRYAGAFPLVIRINSKVPMPFMRSAMAGLIPRIYGTRTDALNMAKVC